ncbi:ABC transporter ATP-binding protein [Actinopolymorpha sp. NPDC004070]|uniref:ABC transporter ATP-binding protein n=1 Tax=Actinopolymorpha sp. NPDC004070 TaxID=3154548 RepID=UPI0033B4F096
MQAYRLAPYLLRRWSALYDERIEDIAALVRRFVRRSAVGSLVGSVVLGGVILLVLQFVRRGDLTLGTAATACVAVLLLVNRTQQAATNLAQTLEHGLHLQEFVELRDRAEHAERTSNAGTAEAEPLVRLTAEDVSFSYPSASRPALDRVSFEIAAGEVIAIVGHNGSGKTTLAKLLCGLYEPTAGAVRWNGRPLSELADGGGLSEVEGGADLSVGQWQRVAIARVLFRNASFVVLDEPTASLDAEAEAELFETIEGLRAGRTVVLISHRFSTVRSADRILVLHEGRLVEHGSHDQLMALGGRYHRMYQLQSSAYVDS